MSGAPSAPFAASLRVRFADTDAQGVVFFANYLTYFDEAMMEYIEWLGVPWGRLEALGVDVVYADARCQYKGACRFPEVLSIQVGVGRIGRSSLTLQFRIVAGEDPGARALGQLTVVFVGLDSRKPVSIPGEIREALGRGEALFEG